MMAVGAVGNRALCGFPKTCGNRSVVSMGLAASTACLSPPRASAAALLASRGPGERERMRAMDEAIENRVGDGRDRPGSRASARAAAGW